MPISCTPNDLANYAKQFQRCDEKTLAAMQTYLLATLAGVSTDPAVLANLARQFEGRCSIKELRAMQVYATCVASGGIPAVNCNLSGAGAPTGVVTPVFVGQYYEDTVSGNTYRSTGLTPADWTLISGGGPSTCGWTWGPDQTTYDLIDIDSDANVQTISFPTLETAGPSTGLIYCFSCTALTSLSFPRLSAMIGILDFNSCTSLTVVDAPLLQNVGGGIVAAVCTSLITLSFPSLTTLTGQFNCSQCFSLTTLNLPSLVTASAGIIGNVCPALTNVDVSSWVPTNATNIWFDGDNLNATSVELILRRCVLAGVTTCAIHLSGGTNAGLASLSAQGQADAATLGAQLTINP